MRARSFSCGYHTQKLSNPAIVASRTVIDGESDPSLPGPSEADPLPVRGALGIPRPFILSNPYKIANTYPDHLVVFSAVLLAASVSRQR